MINKSIDKFSSIIALNGLWEAKTGEILEQRRSNTKGRLVWKRFQKDKTSANINKNQNEAVSISRQRKRTNQVNQNMSKRLLSKQRAERSISRNMLIEQLTFMTVGSDREGIVLQRWPRDSLIVCECLQIPRAKMAKGVEVLQDESPDEEERLARLNKSGRKLVFPGQ